MILVNLFRASLTFFCLMVPLAYAQGSITIAQGTGPETLDAQLSTVQQTLNVSYHINEPLFLFNYETQETEPLLGLSVEMVNDAVWEVKLREGVSFTNGEPFDAEAVKFSIERIGRPELNSPATIYTRSIQSIEVVDTYTVRITTDGPSPIFPLYLTRIAMVPPGYIDENGDDHFAQNPVGTGPFKLVSWVRDDRVVLEANNEYWNGEPSLDEITFVAIPESSTRMAALTTGEADIVTQVAVDQASLLERGGAQVLSIPSLRLMMVAFKLDNPDADLPVQDVRVRQALNYAVDKEALVENILSGYGEVLAGQPLSEEYFGFNPDVEAYPYDPERARELLAEAGYGPENPLQITLYGPQGRYIRDSEIVQAIGGQLSEVGIDAQVEIQEWGLFINSLLAKELSPMAFWGASTVPDADVWLGSMLGSGAAYSTYSNPEFDALISKAGQTLDTDERLELYHQAAQFAHDDAPFIFLYQQVDIYGLNSRVQNWQPSPDESIYLWDVTVE